MKTQFGFLAVGLGIGMGIGWMMGSNSSPVAPPVAAATKSDRPAIASDASTVVGPDEKRATKRERPAAGDKPDQPKVMSFSSSSGGEMTPEMKAIFAKMEEQRKEARIRRIDERLAALKTRLNLTPDQEAKLRALLENSPEMGLGGLPFMTTNVSRDGKGGAVSIGAGVATSSDNANGANFEEQLAALLSPEQRDEFTTFQQEQRENRVEIATNREMAQLQQQLTLTPEQKDQAFQALGDIARKEAENPQRGFDPAAMEAAKQARTDALRPILTPEQMKAYESNPATSFGIPEVTVMPGGAAIRSIIAAPATDK